MNMLLPPTGLSLKLSTKFEVGTSFIFFCRFLRGIVSETCFRNSRVESQLLTKYFIGLASIIHLEPDTYIKQGRTLRFHIVSDYDGCKYFEIFSQ